MRTSHTRARAHERRAISSRPILSPGLISLPHVHRTRLRERVPSSSSLHLAFALSLSLSPTQFPAGAAPNFRSRRLFSARAGWPTARPPPPSPGRRLPRMAAVSPFHAASPRASYGHVPLLCASASKTWRQSTLSHSLSLLLLFPESAWSKPPFFSSFLPFPPTTAAVLGACAGSPRSP